MPQQPNYNLHTYQAATTSGAQPKQQTSQEQKKALTAMTIDDNADRLFWQAVSGRTGPRTTEVPTMKKNTLQETNNHLTQITITNEFEAERHAETKAHSKHERKDTAAPPLFVLGITNTQRLTATTEQAVSILHYTLIIMKTDTIKILAKKPEYHKIIIDILKEKKVELHTYKPRQQRAYRAVIRNLHYSMQEKLVREEIERMEHKIRNLWNIRRRVAGNPLSLFFSDIEPAAENNEIYIEYHKT
jgi:hypothetical protein